MLRDNYEQNLALANARRPGARPCSTSTRTGSAAWSATAHLDRALEFLPTDRQIRERLERRAGPHRPGAGGAARLHQDRARRRAARHRRCPTTRTCAACCTRTSRRRCASGSPTQIDEPPAAPRDHHDRAGQRPGQHAAARPSCTGCARRPGASLEEIVRAQPWPARSSARRRCGTRSRRSTTRSTPTCRPGSGCTRGGSSSAPRAGCSTTGRSRSTARRDHRVLRRAASTQVWSQLPKLLRGADLEWYQQIYDELTGAGVPDELATRVAGFSSAFPALDIVAVADRTGKEPLARRRGLLRPRRPAAASPS